MVCSCAMSSKCVWQSFWLQLIFCSCVNETTLFSFLRSLLCEKQTRWPNDKAIIGLAYCKISWSVRVSQMNYDLLATDKSRYFVQSRPIIVNNPTRFQIEWNYHEVKLQYFPKGLAFHRSITANHQVCSVLAVFLIIKTKREKLILPCEKFIPKYLEKVLKGKLPQLTKKMRQLYCRNTW